jgi:hypothetical protein
MRYRRWFAGAALALLALAFGKYFIDRDAGADRSQTIWPPARAQPTIVPATDDIRHPIPRMLPKHESSEPEKIAIGLPVTTSESIEEP